MVEIGWSAGFGCGRANRKTAAPYPMKDQRRMEVAIDQLWRCGTLEQGLTLRGAGCPQTRIERGAAGKLRIQRCRHQTTRPRSSSASMHRPIPTSQPEVRRGSATLRSRPEGSGSPSTQVLHQGDPRRRDQVVMRSTQSRRRTSHRQHKATNTQWVTRAMGGAA